MEIIIIILLVVVALLLIWVVVGLKKKDGGSDSFVMLQQQNDALRAELKDTLTANTNAVNEQLSRVTTHVSDQLGSVSSQVSKQLSTVTTQMQTSTGQINERMDNAARVVGEVREGLGALGKATEQIFDVGKDIAGLQEILSAPKLRGGLGEFFLGDLLKQILPNENFELQYGFNDGTRVDAVIKLAGGMVPIDSKFPMENFKRLLGSGSDEEKKAHKKKFISDVKKH
ncbi:MAG: DNA recombination protein RmuC, partial [Thermodesulfobacteriota bacterium]